MTTQKLFAFRIAVSVVYLFTAWNSSGYYHWDEHYQIIEFANYKLGNAAVDDLAWEYRACIRPGLQPVLCFIIFKFLSMLGVMSPFTLTLCLRVLTAVTAICAIRFFIIQTKHTLKPELLTYFTLLSFGLWFLPFINVRFSAETWSGIFLLMGIGTCISGAYKKSAASLLSLGILLAIAILFKYQTAIAVAGLLIWALIIDHIRLKKMLVIVAAILVILLFGSLLDFWLYQQFVFTLYNYFHVNLIQGVAAKYGTSPWYEIIIYIVKAPGLGIGLLLLFAILYLVVKKPKSAVIWAVLPYLFVHAIIAHKELRFLFPLANLCPIIIMYTYQDLCLDKRFFSKWPIYFVIAILLSVNAVSLLYVSSKSAGIGKTATLHYIYNHYKGMPVNLIGAGIINPYREFVSPRSTFYLQPKLNYIPIENIWRTDLNAYTKTGFKNVLLIPASEITGVKTYEYLKKFNYVPLYQDVSKFHQLINDWYYPGANDHILILFVYRQPH